MDLKRRRRAIYTGMSPYFDDAELIAALQLWQEAYSDKPKFAFTEFLLACCTTKELKAQRSNILRSIFNAMEMPEHMLLEDPLRSVNKKLELYIQENEPADKTTTLFVSFFECLLSKTNESENEGIRSYIIKQSVKLKVNHSHKKELSEWLDNRANTLNLKYDLSSLRQLVNFAYVALCEYKGPVKADQLLSQAIKETEPLANELQVNLHDFL